MTITENKTAKAIEYNVTDGRYSLNQIAFNDGSKFNEAVMYFESGDTEIISIHSAEIQPLFIALHNFKNKP